MKRSLAGLAVLALAAVAAPAHSAVSITEVAPYASGNAPYAADWFEITNTGASAVNLSGWKVDDSSASFAAALALRGVGSIAAGQSVVFMEGKADGSTDAALKTSFIAAWFNGAAPTGFAMGFYGGSGIGLGTGGDAVNLYNSSGVLQAGVTFGSSSAGPVYQTFDNAVGSSGAISQLSALGVHAARASVSGLEIGSPGAVAAVPEPETYAMLLVGLGLIGAIARKRLHKQ